MTGGQGHDRMPRAKWDLVKDRTKHWPQVHSSDRLLITCLLRSYITTEIKVLYRSHVRNKTFPVCCYRKRINDRVV